MTQRQFVSLGMFIVDQFLFEDEDGNPTGRSLDPQVRLWHGGKIHPQPTCVLAAHLPLPERRLEAVEFMLLSELESGWSSVLTPKSIPPGPHRTI